MSRKRKPDDTSSTDTTTVTPDVPAEGAATAVATPPASPGAEAAPAAEDAERPSFAERVRPTPRVKIPDPFGIAADYLAGVRLFESRQDRQVAIKFGDGSLAAKPSQAVIDKVKEAGYRWDPAYRIWTHPVRPDSAMTTRIDAERLYQEVRQMIREEHGIEPSQELPI